MGTMLLDEDRAPARADVRVTHTVVPSPVGPTTLVARDGRLSALLMPDSKYAEVQGPFGERDDDGFEDARTQLAEYFAGQRTAFDLPLALVGTAFQVRIWEGLQRIPYGQTWSYGELAASVGLDPRTSSRAVGGANGRNRIGIVVPCHRVIGADGTLTGFAAGLHRKRFLLDLERGGPDLLF
jgi:methylated-DNA-[protein]-cysteine S-methyltransferase